MNYLIISDFNIAGQCTALMRAINKYTDDQARCIIAYDDHFAYDRDILLNKETLEEAAYLANEWADFFHFGSYIFNFPGVDFNQLVTNRNSCIKYYGSYLRDNGQKCRDFHQRTGIAAITGTDFTITGLLPESYYHLNSYFVKFGDMELDQIPKCNPYLGSGTFRICAGSAGHPNKGYQVLCDVMNELDKEGYDIDLDFIHGISNEEALERKKKAHACFCSLNGGWGISGVESMFMGQPTLTALDPFILSLFPDQPSIIVNKEILKDQILNLMGEGKEGPTIRQVEWRGRSVISRNFAIQNFQWKDIVERYMYLFDLIQHKDEYLKGGRIPDKIY